MLRNSASKPLKSVIFKDDSYLFSYRDGYRPRDSAALANTAFPNVRKRICAADNPVTDLLMLHLTTVLRKLRCDDFSVLFFS